MHFFSSLFEGLGTDRPKNTAGDVPSVSPLVWPGPQGLLEDQKLMWRSGVDKETTCRLYTGRILMVARLRLAWYKQPI